MRLAHDLWISARLALRLLLLVAVALVVGVAREAMERSGGDEVVESSLGGPPRER